LIRDVGTRSRPRLRGDVEPVDHPSVAGDYVRDDGRTLRLAFGAPRMFGGERPLSIVEIEEGETREVESRDWAPETMSVRIRLSEPGTGRSRERVLFVEDGQLVEGPSDTGPDPAPAALWKRASTTSG
jgi:hypothetical protein